MSTEFVTSIVAFFFLVTVCHCCNFCLYNVVGLLMVSINVVLNFIRHYLDYHCC